jgi:hypothetical protein
MALAGSPATTHPAQTTTPNGSRAADIPIRNDVIQSGQPNLILGSLLGQTGLPAGVAQIHRCSVTSAANLNVKQGTTVLDATKAFADSNPDYRWSEDKGVINLIPATGFSLLDTRVRHFDLNATDKTATPELVLDELLRLPEVSQRAVELKLVPGLSQGGPGVYDEHPIPSEPIPIHIRFANVSLRQAFNLVARTFGHTIWIYAENECGGKTTYTVSVQKD